MGLYNKQGLLNGYKKNNAKREALDYYATPSAEVTNILNAMNFDFGGGSLLEPCAGGGHMVKGILDYTSKHPERAPREIITTEIKERDGIWDELGVERPRIYNFLDDDYPYNEMDYIIVNPPYYDVEPFVIRSLEIARKGLLMLGRIQFLEGKSRYENILRENPPTDVYVYVDRIKCFKNGDFSQTESSAQAYIWVYWNKSKENAGTALHWIRRVN